MGASTSTTVTNYFDKPVYARVDRDKMECDTSVKNAEDINSVISGFTKIMPKKSVTFDAPCFGENPVYISVFYTENDQLKWIANDLPRKKHVNINITRHSQLENSN